jgi:hypothetical protein
MIEVTAIYISGKITGDNNYREKFMEAENKQYDAGYFPLNPASNVRPNMEWHKAMRKALQLMLEGDGVALLPDWKKSRGAKIEARLARKLGIPVKPIKAWLNGKA